ncbi:hypothetical protein LTR86_003677 [Recurvomyces mirabilis]|nr:hypothetical protein LTR86_003677 [Recurvomyces mirabilis]
MVNGGLVHELQHSADLFNGQYTATSVTITISAALAVYNALELVLLILTTFRRFNGLYFWSLCAATYGVLMYTTGFMIEYFQFAAQLTGLTIRVLGWPNMITGQSLVLYSRLSLVMGQGYDNLLRALKWMIIFDAVVHHSGTIILTFGAYYASPSASWIHAYNVQHKIQRTGFCIQEGLLSLIYIWRALSILRQTSSLRNKKQTWLLMWQLIVINVVIEALDIFILVEEYTALHATKQATKALMYSIKLKLEFAVLGRLVEVTGHRDSNERPVSLLLP